MAATPYRPISWTDKNLTQEKLQQLSNNDQWLFENSPRLRYNYQNGLIVRDNGLKIIVGKTAYGTRASDAVDIHVYFGSFFSAACKPVISISVETTGAWLRKRVTIRGIGGEIDYRGFVAHLSTDEPYVAKNIEAPGWIHWHAAGF